MNCINLDIEKAFDNEPDNAHAIDTIGNFLKSIIETGEIDYNKIVIEKIAFLAADNHPEDTLIEIDLENNICAAIKKICSIIINVAEDRLIHNKKLQNALEIINKEIKNH
jgi:hypothetical protein